MSTSQLQVDRSAITIPMSLQIKLRCWEVNEKVCGVSSQQNNGTVKPTLKTALVSKPPIYRDHLIVFQ